MFPRELGSRPSSGSSLLSDLGQVCSCSCASVSPPDLCLFRLNFLWQGLSLTMCTFSAWYKGALISAGASRAYHNWPSEARSYIQPQWGQFGCNNNFSMLQPINCKISENMLGLSEQNPVEFDAKWKNWMKEMRETQSPWHLVSRASSFSQVCNCLESKEPVDGTVNIFQHNKTPSRPLSSALPVIPIGLKMLTP